MLTCRRCLIRCACVLIRLGRVGVRNPAASESGFGREPPELDHFYVMPGNEKAAVAVMNRPKWAHPGFTATGVGFGMAMGC